MTHRLLIVDDDVATRQLLLRLFTRKGWEVDTAGTGTAALAQAQTGNYDCVVIDCHLPEMDGRAVARALQEMGQACPPLVGVSAGDEEAERPSCLNAGMSAYIAKPFVLSNLVERVERVIFGDTSMGRIKTEPAPIAHANPEPALDLECFHSQVALLGGVASRSTRDLVEVFLNACDSRLAAMKAAVEDGDSERVKEIAHAVRGSAGNLGARELATRCEALEALAKSGKAPGPGDLAQLTRAVERCRAVLHNTLTGESREALG